jgi:putative ABC transport system permease protein
MNWTRRLFHRSRAEKELDEEVRFHLERQIADFVTTGVNPAEAKRRAMQTLGGLERVKQEVRDAHWESHIENIFRDLRYALRSLRRDLPMSLVAVSALALGIGACTVVFSVIYNSFFGALPYKNFRRSVVWQLHNSGNLGDKKDRKSFSLEEVRAFREQNHVFQDIIGYVGIRPLYDDGTSTRYWPFGALVTANTFDYLGVPPLLGRGISQDDGGPDAPSVFVMSYRLWQQEFNSDPKILGKTFILILFLVLFNGFRLVALGTGLGLAASYALTRLLANQISGVSATDPGTFAAVAFLTVCVGLAACLPPARRAARLDPLVSIRHE